MLNEPYIKQKLIKYLKESKNIGWADVIGLFPGLNSDEYDVIRKIITDQCICVNNIEINGHESKKLTKYNIESLTNEQLCIKYRDGEDIALQILIEKNKGFVYSVAKKYQGLYNHHLTICDLVSYGNIGLIDAVKRFDPEKGQQFTTYAVWWIRQAILYSIVNYGFLVRIPMNVFDDVRRIQKYARKYSYLSPCELIIKLEEHGYEPNRAEFLMIILDQTARNISIFAHSSDVDDSCLEDILSTDELSPLEILEENERNEMINQVLSELEDRDRSIIEQYYGLNGNVPNTLGSVGLNYNISRERARQLLAKTSKIAAIKMKNLIRQCKVNK